MAKKKQDLAEDVARYGELMDAARRSEFEGMYATALQHAEAAWEYVDGMMQYERRFEQRTQRNSVSAIDMALRYAVLLFRYETLNRLASLLKAQKRIEKNTTADLGARLGRAHEQLRANHRLFGFLEQHPDTRQDQLRQHLGGEQDHWRTTVEAWAKMGLVERTPEGGSYRVRLSTRLGQITPAKCSSCGRVEQAPKAMFLTAVTCVACRSPQMFVLMS